MSAWLIPVAALGCALMGGVFFAFSSFVMPALGNVPTSEGIRAMQRINIDVYHWSFMGAFMAMPSAAGLGWQASVTSPLARTRF